MAEDLQRTKLSERLEKHVRQKVDHYFENAAKEKAEREVSQFISFSPSFESELTFLI